MEFGFFFLKRKTQQLNGFHFPMLPGWGELFNVIQHYDYRIKVMQPRFNLSPERDKSVAHAADSSVLCPPLSLIGSLPPLIHRDSSD